MYHAKRQKLRQHKVFIIKSVYNIHIKNAVYIQQPKDL